MRPGLENRFPFNLLASVSAIRETPPSNGTCAMVITNDYQNFGLFRRTDSLPGLEENPQGLIVGGKFTTDNPGIPIHIFVQNGGSEVESSIIVDDLNVNIE